MDNRSHAPTVAVLLGVLVMVLVCAGASFGQVMPDPEDFVTEITNRYFPLKPGTTFVYSGPTDEGPQTLLITVTHETKLILGVETTVVTETLTVDGILNEVSVNWFAQDKDDNVWYLGEDSKEYEDGEVVSTAGSWEAGVNGATAGIIMLGDPRDGDIYNQENAPGVAEDMAEVLSVNKRVLVPLARFSRVLYTQETTPLAPGVVDFNYYARGIGLVLEVDAEGNRLELYNVIRSESD